MLCELALFKSHPIMSGDFTTAHKAKCVLSSVKVMPPFPTSSMSGSFQPPGPALSGYSPFS